jgi:hypothetical protein
MWKGRARVSTRLIAVLVVALGVVVPRTGAAEETGMTVQPLPSAPPQPPPYPQYPQSPPYMQPYAPPQGAYLWMPPRAFREGDPVPPGFHVEEEPRHGMVVAGWTLLLVSYGISVIVAAGVQGNNGGDWLYAPIVGPWALLATRSYNGCSSTATESGGLGCVGDVYAVMGLVVDGLLEGAGAALLIVGYADSKSVLVRNAPAFRVAPMRMGSGNGVGLTWAF